MKLINFLTATILLLFAIHTQAADTTKTAIPAKGAYFSFAIGPGFPIGAYSSNVPTANSQDGNASVGLSYNMEMVQFFTKHFGLGATVGHFKNEAGAYAAIIDSTFNPPSTSPSPIGTWASTYGALMPVISANVANNVYMDIKFFGGFIHTRYPGIYIPTTTAAYSENLSPLYGYGANIRANLSERIQFKISADFLYAKGIPFSASYNSKPVIFVQDIGIMNITFGLCVFFLSGK